jgi:hypothetical protein
MIMIGMNDFYLILLQNITNTSFFIKIAVTMKKDFAFVLFLLMMMTPSTLVAQNRFKAGVAMGVNLAQLDGDLQQGYDKVGFNLGLKGAFVIKPQFDISTELFFNQKGAVYSGNANILDAKKLYPTITLNYADVLIMANFNFSPNDAETFYKHTFQLGISLGRLVSSKTSVQKGITFDNVYEQELSKNYKSNDVALVVGWSWFVSKKIGLNIRHTLSVTNMYDNPTNVGVRDLGISGFQSFRSYFLSAHIFYNFISPKKLGLGKKKKKKSSDEAEEL